MTDLAKRAVACKGWRWLPGMLLRKYGRLLRVDAGHIYTDTCGWSSDEALTWKGGLAIDLTDPATVGALLALAAGDDTLWECGVHPDGGGFFTIADKTWTGATLAHAAVAALESAP